MAPEVSLFLALFVPIESAIADDRPESFLKLGLETAVDLPSEKISERFKVLVDHPLSRHVGVTATALITPAWSQVYAGPSFHFGNLGFDFGVGMETDPLPIRLAATVHWNPHRFDLLAMVEHGGSGPWYRGVAKFSFDPVWVGVFAHEMDGVGPWLSLSTHGFEVWTVPIYIDPFDGSKGVVAGMSWKP